MNINIVAGGPIDLQTLKKYYSDITIGVDNGAYRLMKADFKLDIAIGDFDSITSEQLTEIREVCKNVKKYNPVKNKSDTELALDFALSLNPNVVNIFGVTGKRIDHFLSVLYLFHKVLHKVIKLNIIDEYNKIYVLKPGTHKVKKTHFHYISFFSFDECVTGFTIEGFKYPLKNHTIKNDDSLCVSNEIVSDFGIITFSSGILLIVESID